MQNSAQLKRLRLLLLLTAIILGAADTWSSGYTVNPMGISYVDMGEAFLRGHWSTAINGLWSPIYGIVLSLVIHVFKPNRVWMFPLIHLANFFIFLTTLFSFDLFLKEIIKSRNDEAELSGLSAWSLVFFGYALFLWSSLGLIRIATTAPDLFLATVTYLAFALLLRVRRGLNGWPAFLILGLVLGFGYLLKTVMLPLAILFILAAWVLTRRLQGAPLRLGAAMLGLIVMAGPFIAALSITRHRLTIGDSGNLNYLWHVNRVSPFHWQGDSRFGFPIHPTRKILDVPAVFEFGSPLRVTYPPWYDPSYWYEGARSRFDLHQQLAALAVSIRAYFEIFTYTSHLLAIGGFFLLLYIGRENSFKPIRQYWPILILIVCGFGIYLPVHVEPRYVAAWIPPLWLLLYSGLRFPSTPKLRRPAVWLVAFLALVIILAQTSRSFSALRAASTHTGATQLQVADALDRAGLKPGDPVGLINFNPFWLPVVHWAWLAQVRIVAELPNTDVQAFISGDENQKQRVVTAFQKSGAKAIVAAEVPESATLANWERIGSTSYYFLKLTQSP